MPGAGGHSEQHEEVVDPDPHVGRSPTRRWRIASNIVFAVARVRCVVVPTRRPWPWLLGQVVFRVQSHVGAGRSCCRAQPNSVGSRGRVAVHALLPWSTPVAPGAYRRSRQVARMTFDGSMDVTALERGGVAGAYRHRGPEGRETALVGDDGGDTSAPRARPATLDVRPTC